MTPSPLPKLIALLALAIADATDQWRNGDRSPARFVQAMQSLITRGMTAAYFVATAARVGLPVAAIRGLSRIERAELKAAIVTQLDYLPGFVAAMPTMSDAQIAARALQYATGIKTPFFAVRWGAWVIPERLLPGQQVCQGNCNCSITIRDNGDGTGVLTRMLGGTANCGECPPLAGDHPVQRRRT